MGLFTGLDYLTEVIGFQLAMFAWELYLDYRQYRRSFDAQPENTKAIEEDGARYLRSQEYSRARLLFGMSTGWLRLGKELALLACFVYPQVWAACGQHFGDGSRLQALVYFFGLGTLDGLFELPFEAYSTFVIEQRFGFNKTTWRTFALDFVKATLLSVLLGAPVLLLVVWILEAAAGGAQLWLYLWLLFVAVMLLFVAVKPALIDPLFNTYAPLPDGELRARIEALARRLRFPLGQLFVVDGSTRSDHSNAYFFGLWNKRIVLYDTLLKQLDVDQIEAVLGHELGHWACWHTYCQLAFSQLYLGAFLAVAASVIYSPDLYAAFGFATHAPIIGLKLFSQLTGPLDHLLTFVVNYMTRAFEYQADRFAARLGYAAPLGHALVKLAKKNLGNLNNDPLYSMYHFTHPTTPERLTAIAAHQAKLQ